MLPEPPPNTISRPYRGLSMQESDVELTRDAIEATFVGREAYRRTEYLVLRRGAEAALLSLRKADDRDLFSPITELRVLAEPHETVVIESPDTDVSNATALAQVAAASGRNALAYVVIGKFEHVNFIWKPTPVTIRVTEVVPPQPPKLLSMCEQAVAFDEDLPPIDLQPDLVDVENLMAINPADWHLLPCRGSGAGGNGHVEYLDTRPAVMRDWTLIGCERSCQFHRHFYGSEPASQVDLCPLTRTGETGTPVVAKCCLLERGVERGDGYAVVPWGSNLDEVRAALRWLTGVAPVEPVSEQVVPRPARA